MNDKFLKARIPNELYVSLLARANADGKRLGTHVRELLEVSELAITTQDALTRIESALRHQAKPEQIEREIGVDADTRKSIREVRLIAIELAMHLNAQILPRVAAQLKTNQTN